ncbi:fungal-specific transcription factor domain-containing protein [Mycena crocata]|nr:fungal-specific transcription factor domain-containing protein [Mycena crocata]
MSSNEHAFDLPNGKRRHIERACDLCRRRKTRCDSSDMNDEKCSACYEAGVDCTYLKAPPKRARPQSPPKTYVASLEERLEESIAMIRALRTDLAAAHFKRESTGPTSRSSMVVDTATKPNSANGNATMIDNHTAYLHMMRIALRAWSSPPPPSQADDFVHIEIGHRHQSFSSRWRFMGRSSSALLVRAVRNLKEEVKREEEEIDMNGMHMAGLQNRNRDPWASRRIEYWTFKPWDPASQQLHPPRSTYTFPPPPILAHLTDLYFTHANIYIPILHRPTFERAVEAGLHLEDNDFAPIVLLVCAIGSRWSDDPVAMGLATTNGNGGATTSGAPRLACGWAWFNQVPHRRADLFGQATLHVLQYHCLVVRFLEGSTAPQVCWTLIGVGLRIAQDVGAHRRDACVKPPSVEHELWKRAFWVLVYMDRIVSASLGRGCVAQYIEIDLDPPLDVDEEYWEHPQRPFCQPPGVPARVTFFNTLLRLNHILATGLKLLYSPMKMRTVFDLKDGWQEACVAELDSALHTWREQVPDHLRWDPMRADTVFFDQSVALHCEYSQVQILFHRSFIPMMQKASPKALSSLAICTGAARACANMVDLQRRRKGNVPVIINGRAVFVSCLVFLLNILSGRWRGNTSDTERETADVNKCMAVLRLCEDRWQAAGIYRDILAELSSVGQLPLPPEHGPLGPGVHQVDTAGNANSGAQSTGWAESLALSAEDVSRMMHNPGTFGGAPMEPSIFAPKPAPTHRAQPTDTYVSRHSTLAAHPTTAESLEYTPSMIDSDTLALWTNAPTGLKIDHWESYLSNLSDNTQGGGIWQ